MKKLYTIICLLLITLSLASTSVEKYNNKGQLRYASGALYDVSGNLMEMIISDYYAMGSYQLNWDGSFFPSGIYILQMEIDNAVLRRKMVLIK